MNETSADSQELNDFDTEALGRRIAAARKARGISQMDLALDVGVTQGAVSGWESGRYPMVLQKLPALCRSLGVTPNDLLPDAGDVPVGEVHKKGRAGAMRLVAKVSDLHESGVLTPERVGLLMALLEDFEKRAR